MSIDLKNIKKVHCVGIGGIGVSAVARLFADRGASVSGSDMSDSPVTEGLRAAGIAVHIGHDASHVAADTDLVIHTIAVPGDNPELIAARQAGIAVRSYPEVLGLLSENFYTVAVSGTHGKTTTTAMLARVLSAADRDPTVIVGSLLHEEKSNFIAGSSDLLVVEACEYRRSFLHLHPDLLIITNVDTDHLDYFEDLSDIQDAFSELAGNVADDGVVVCDPEAENLAPVINNCGADLIDFADIDLEGELEVPGEHNRQNGQAATAAASYLGVDVAAATASIRSFAGTWRRAQKKGELDSGALVFDDYGHHPTEISSTLAGFRSRWPDRKLIVAFQPHLYSRTKQLLAEFSKSFTDADRVLILPIYAAREAPDPDISAELLVEKLIEQGTAAELVADFSVAEKRLRELADDETLILTQGAGDIYQVADNLTL